VVASGRPCLVVSASEREALGGAATIRVVPNGVDGAAFPYREGGRLPARLIFAGNLGYFPNVDAAAWLVQDVLPRVRVAVPAAELRLVGARPARAVRALATRPGVSLAAAVPAMAPELAAAAVAVIPLRAGSGLQNKVLEAMAVGTPVVATPAAVRGIEARAGEHLLVADDAGGLAEAAIALLRDPARGRALARAARALVEERYRWEDSAAGVEAAWRAAVSP
jgi:glycosyltransferase involved in cell wall biosynthesis